MSVVIWKNSQIEAYWKFQDRQQYGKLQFPITKMFMQCVEKFFAVHIVSKYVSKLTQNLKLENFLIQQMQMLEKEKTKIKDTKR